MSREISEILPALDREEIYPFFAVELMFDEESYVWNGEPFQSAPLYLWTGLGDLTVGGVTYAGTGGMMNISEVKETADVSAAGATLSLTGIPSEIISLAIQQPYQGRKCVIKFGIMDANRENLLRQDGSFILLEDSSSIDVSIGEATGLTTLFVGYMDQMNIDEQAEHCTIAVAVENKLIDLERPRIRRYTSESQKSFFPNDLAFDFIPDLQDTPLSWGRT